MGPSHRPTLHAGLALAARAVAAADGSIPAASDPLRLDLPSIGAGGGTIPSAATLRVFASLYLGSELEQAGVVAIAELLVQERYGLPLTDIAGASKLETFATNEHQWYPQATRTQLYARLFGSGPAATNDAGTMVNREFVGLLGTLCRAVVAFASATLDATSSASEPVVREAATELVGNLAERALGNTLLAARRLEDQLRAAIDILRDPAICALVGARTLQQAIVAILGSGAPDVQRLIDAGLNGQKLLEWLADRAAALGDSAATPPLITFGDPVSTSAALWLHAVGMEAPAAAHAGSVA